MVEVVYCNIYDIVTYGSFRIERSTDIDIHTYMHTYIYIETYGANTGVPLSVKI